MFKNFKIRPGCRRMPLFSFAILQSPEYEDRDKVFLFLIVYYGRKKSGVLIEEIKRMMNIDDEEVKRLVLKHNELVKFTNSTAGIPMVGVRNKIYKELRKPFFIFNK